MQKNIIGSTVLYDKGRLNQMALKYLTERAQLKQSKIHFIDKKIKIE